LPSPHQVAATVHNFFYKRGYAVGCVHPSDDLSGLKAYIIPHWALFNPEWLPNLTSFVENGGTLVIGARTATKDWNNNVVAQTPPGALVPLTGARVAEYGRQNAPDKRPLRIKFPKAKVPTSYWYEILEVMPGSAVMARWEGRLHLELKPAIMMKKIGAGATLYVGTYFTEEILEQLLPALEERNDLAPLWPSVPENVHVVVRENDEKRLWFFINDTDGFVCVENIPEGEDLVKGRITGKFYLKRNEIGVVKQLHE
jgi:beta-galactosidase